MKFLKLFEVKRTPRPIKPSFVSDVEAVMSEEVKQLWDAIGVLREDISESKRVAAKAERAVYRRAPRDEAGNLVDDNHSEPKPQMFRTGDPIL